MVVPEIRRWGGVCFNLSFISCSSLIALASSISSSGVSLSVHLWWISGVKSMIWIWTAWKHTIINWIWKVKKMWKLNSFQCQMLKNWPWIFLTCGLSNLGGMGHVWYLTRSPFLGIYSPSISEMCMKTGTDIQVVPLLWPFVTWFWKMNNGYVYQIIKEYPID